MARTRTFGEQPSSSRLPQNILEGRAIPFVRGRASPLTDTAAPPTRPTHCIQYLQYILVNHYFRSIFWYGNHNHTEGRTVSLALSRDSLPPQPHHTKEIDLIRPRVPPMPAHGHNATPLHPGSLSHRSPDPPDIRINMALAGTMQFPCPCVKRLLAFHASWVIARQ